MLEDKVSRSARRVNANFSEETYATVQRLAQRRGKSISEVLRDAVVFEEWYQQTADAGDRILVEREDGSLREIVRT